MGSRTRRRKRRFRAVYAGTPEHQFVPGIPARDLSADEVERYGGAVVLRRAGCYELVALEKEPVESPKEGEE